MSVCRLTDIEAYYNYHCCHQQPVIIKMPFTNVNVSSWIDTNTMYTFDDVCRKLRINTTDVFTQCILNMDLTNDVIINEYYLDLMGFAGKSFKSKQKKFKQLLKRNPDITFERIRDPFRFNRRYHIIKGWDFEAIFMQVESTNADLFRRQSNLLRNAFQKYWEYRELYYLRNK